MKKSILAIVSLAMVAAATPAHAESMQIKYSDLNLASAEGRAALEGRIDRAAKKICGLSPRTTGTRIKSRSAQLCFNETKKAAAAQMAVVVDQNRLGG